MSQRSTSFSYQEHHAPVPFWRDVRVLRWLFQFVVLLLLIGLFVLLGDNLQDSLRRRGLNLSFEFLNRRAGFNIGDAALNYSIEDPMWKAYLVGIVNTLRVASAGIVLATLLGTLVGIARLSRNWLASRMALVFVEIMQNTPLLVQLFFWFVLIKSLPRQLPEEVVTLPANPVHVGPIRIPPLIYLSQRGGAVPGIGLLDSFRFWWPFVLLGFAAAVGAYYLRITMQKREGIPPTGQWVWASLAFVLILALGWWIVPGAPLEIEIPELAGDIRIFSYVGGWQLSDTLMALLIGLVLYTAAFIAEVVRAGIQAVSYGQIEAATSLGLTRGQQLRLILLPQAMRIIIPPLINQYLNLTKNSSLAIAVGYPDLFNISQTIGNQTGQNIQVITMVMATYLLFSLVISLVMNFVNQRLQIVER